MLESFENVNGSVMMRVLHQQLDEQQKNKDLDPGRRMVLEKSLTRDVAVIEGSRVSTGYVIAKDEMFLLKEVCKMSNIEYYYFDLKKEENPFEKLLKIEGDFKKEQKSSFLPVILCENFEQEYLEKYDSNHNFESSLKNLKENKQINLFIQSQEIYSSYSGSIAPTLAVSFALG